jgi:hypothetical protein
VQQSGSDVAMALESEALHEVPDSRPVLTMSDSEMLEVPDSQPEGPELTMSDSEMLEVPDSQPEGPELTMSGEMLEVPDSQPEGPELTMSGEMLEVPDSQPEGPELTMSDSEALEEPAAQEKPRPPCKTCETCGKKFKHQRYLKRHKEKRHAKPFKCTVRGCPKRFDKKESSRKPCQATRVLEATALSDKEAYLPREQLQQPFV